MDVPFVLNWDRSRKSAWMLHASCVLELPGRLLKGRTLIAIGRKTGWLLRLHGP